MAIKDTSKTLRTLLEGILSDLDKADAGNKAAAQRVRTLSIKSEKVAKLYRKESIKADKSGLMNKTKAASRKKSSPSAAPAAKKARPAPAKKRAPAKKASPAKKRPTAKLPKAKSRKR